VHVEALEHLSFDIFDVGELAPTSDIAVFTGALNLGGETGRRLDFPLVLFVVHAWQYPKSLA
jgi:hypothetical protein